MEVPMKYAYITERFDKYTCIICYIICLVILSFHKGASVTIKINSKFIMHSLVSMKCN